MTAKLNRCYFQSGYTGTGALAYATTIEGYLSPTNADAVDEAEYAYIAEDADLSQWEIGIGVFDSDTQSLARDTIVESSNGGAVVDFTTAPKVRMGVPLAADFPGSVSATTVGGEPLVLALSAPGVIQVNGDILPAAGAWTGPLNVGFSRAEQITIGGLGVIDGALTEQAGYATTLSLPDLQVVTGGVDLSGGALTTLSLPECQVIIGGLQVGNNTALTTFSLPALILFSGTFSAGGNALDETSVDGLLVTLAALDGTGGTYVYQNASVDLTGGTNAQPSATGLTAKAILEGRGCTVSVN